MKKRARGFTLIEVILYIGLFSLLGTALFTFAWDVIGVTEQGRTDRLLTEEARFAAERIKTSIRSAAGIDVENSVWDSTDGRLVLEVFGSSDTITFERQNERLIMQVSGQDPVFLQSADTRNTTLLFERSHAVSAAAEYVDLTLTTEMVQTASPLYASALTLQIGAALRNLDL